MSHRSAQWLKWIGSAMAGSAVCVALDNARADDPLGYAFVLAEIDPPNGTLGELVEIVDINQAGDVVAVFDNAGTPSTWVWRIACNNWFEVVPTGVTGPVGQALNDSHRVVGWADTATEPVGWVWDPTPSTQKLDESEAHDVNGAGTAVGWLIAPDPDRPAAWTGNSFQPLITPSPWTASCALGINWGGGYIVGAATKMCGLNEVAHAVQWQTTNFWVMSDECQPGAIDEYARAVNDNRWACGWRGAPTPPLDGRCFEDKFGCNPVPPQNWASDGMVWEYIGNDDWTPHVIAAVEVIDDINNHNEAVGGTRLWTGVDLQTRNLWDFTRVPPDIVSFIATAINDDGHIAGIGLKGVGYEKVPIKIVPYDTNHNGVPDYRDILAGGFSDTNSNWIPDGNEAAMRVGFHAPGLGTSSPQVTFDPTQVIRFIQGQTDVKGIVNNTGGACDAFVSALDAWATGGDSTNEDDHKEIVFSVRSRDSTVNSFDRIPPDFTTGNDDGKFDVILPNLTVFAHRFAWCIDYYQLGNEFSEGNGNFLFDDYGTGGGPYTYGPTAQFTSIEWCNAKDALDDVFEWVDQQTWAVLRGSALGGNPARIITPAVTLQQMADSNNWGSPPVEPENESCADPGYDRRMVYAIQRTIDYANTNKFFLDFHLHYQVQTVPSGLDQYHHFGLDRLAAAYDDNPPPWYPGGLIQGIGGPEQMVALEWGPSPQQSWETANADEAANYYDDFGLPRENTYPTWQAFVDTWEAQFDDGNNIKLQEALDDLTDPDVEGHFFNLVCYGPVLQGATLSPPSYELQGRWGFDMAALRSNRIYAPFQTGSFTDIGDIDLPNAITNLGLVIDWDIHVGGVPHPNGCTADCDGICP